MKYIDFRVTLSYTSTKHYKGLPLNQKRYWLFYFNKYKTAGIMGKQVFDVPKELQAILDLFIKNRILKSDYLLQSYDKPSFTTADMNALIKQIFQKNIGVSTLRNIYLTNKFGPAVNKLKQIADEMGTSTHVALSTYIAK